MNLKVQSALKGLLSPDELTGEQQEEYLDKLSDGYWESSPVLDAFFEDRRQRGVGVGMDEEGNIVQATPTKVSKLAKNLEE